MRAFSPKQNQPREQISCSLVRSNTATSGPIHHTHPIPHLQRTIGSQAGQPLLMANADELEESPPSTTSPNFAHDFSRIPVSAKAPLKIQPKLTINTPGDRYEQEADRVANQLMRMPASQQQQVCACGGGCPKCQAEQLSHQSQVLQKMRVQDSDTEEVTAPAMADNVLRSSGQPLDQATRAFFEPRFGHDFSQVRVHTDSEAVESARSINAVAYTAGHNIVFGTGKSPGPNLLTAHELTHVVQQTAHSNRLSNNIQRLVDVGIGADVAFEMEAIACLRGLFDEMSRQTWWYLETACSDGNYLTSRAGVEYIPEDRADAFGHCWIGCQGAKTCGQETTRSHGGAYEIFREAMSYLTLGLWGHNSYQADTFNQRFGRELARAKPFGDCSSLCYQAVVNGSLRFHGHNTSRDPTRPRVYNCSGITIDGHEYRQGWRTIPEQHLRRF